MRYRYIISYFIDEKYIILKKNDKRIRVYDEGNCFVCLENEIFEPRVQMANPFHDLLYARHTCISRVDSFKKKLKNEEIKIQEIYKDIFTKKYKANEFIVLEFAKANNIDYRNINVVISLEVQDRKKWSFKIDILSKFKKDGRQIIELINEYEELRKLFHYRLDGYILNNKKSIVYDGSLDFLLSENNSYFFIFYRVEIHLNFVNGTSKKIIRDFSSTDSVNNRYAAILFLESFYNGLFLNDQRYIEPKSDELIMNEFYIHRELTIVPCPYAKRKCKIDELKDNPDKIKLTNNILYYQENKEKLEKERSLFQELSIDVNDYEAIVNDSEKGFITSHIDKDFNEHLYFVTDQYYKYRILKGSNILVKGKFRNKPKY